MTLFSIFRSKGPVNSTPITCHSHPRRKAVPQSTQKNGKFIIWSSQDAFLKTINTVIDIKLELNARKSLHIEYKLTTQPLIFMVEESMNFYTVYEDIIYKFDSLIHALSSALKIHYVFNIEYQ